MSNKIVTIETACDEQSLSKCHRQPQSKLFALPKELRVLVYEFVALPTVAAPSAHGYSDVAHIQDASGGYVSNHECLALPQTRRLAGLEAGTLALRTAQIDLRVHADLTSCADRFRRARVHREQHQRIHSLLSQLTPLNIRFLSRCHIDSDSESCLRGGHRITLEDLLCGTTLFAWPKVLGITIHFIGTSIRRKNQHLRGKRVARLAKRVQGHDRLRNVLDLTFELFTAFHDEDVALWKQWLQDPEHCCLGWSSAQVSV